jgi:hypothetical protein
MSVYICIRPHVIIGETAERIFMKFDIKFYQNSRNIPLVFKIEPNRVPRWDRKDGAEVIPSPHPQEF